MVFESLVVELVNKYLGDFIENLDKSQLKIGIWGGDVVLNDLFIKESALDDLDLPIRVLHGNLGKLTLKIPWKNLYTAPVEATLDGLYIVAVPNNTIKYNAEKEAKAEWDAKQKELARIEEAKKAEAEKNKPKDPKQDTFAEKMATQVIKNLQVTINNIHVRYEDHFTNPKKPIAIGATLKGLYFQTTDENWKPTIIKDTVTKIFKMVTLDSLAVYWNSDCESYLKLPRTQVQTLLKDNIASIGFKPDYQYLIDPISSSAQLRLHTKPEIDDFSLPKVLLNVIFQQIAIGLARSQYLDVMEMLESFERMNLASKFRMYHPGVEKKGNGKIWWHFAYNCILEETVRRRRRMWSWKHIKAHRALCRDYKAAYKKKLSNKKIGKDVQETLDGCERVLNVFNLTLLRQQAEVEVKKEGIKKASSGGGGWFSGWWGGGKKEVKKGEEDLGEQFQKLMTPEEKAKLYEAIGYQENATDPSLPKEFVANKVHFKLGQLSLTLKDSEHGNSQIVKLGLQDLFAALDQRPSADAIKLQAKIDSLAVVGSPVGTTGQAPLMVSSQNKAENQTLSLMDLLFETNPLDGGCDQRVRLNARPLEIIYDANTINQVADFFKPPESVFLKQLQAAAMAKFDDLKEQTATGLAHAIEHHKYMDINVDLQPSHVIVPDKGFYRRDCRMIVLDLGNLQVCSEKQHREPLSPSAALESGNAGKLSFDEIKQKAFDRFKINLNTMQLLYVNQGEDWKVARQGICPMHVLRPLSLNIDLDKSILQDPNIPKMCISGVLPEVNVFMSDSRLQEIISLVDSIPFPQGAPPPPEDEFDYESPDIQNVAMEGNADALLRKIPLPGEEEEAKQPLQRQQSSEYVNSIDVELKFEIKQICLNLAQRQDGEDVPMMKIVVDTLGTALQVRTFDMMVTAYLGGVYIQHTQFKASEALQSWLTDGKVMEDGPLITLVNTPVADEESFRLLSVEYTKANKKGPEFSTTYKNTEQNINVSFTALEVVLHQEALLSLMEFAQKLTPPPKPIETIQAETVTTVSATPGAKPEVTAEKEEEEQVQPQKRRQSKEAEIIDLAVKAELKQITVKVCSQAQALTDIRIKGLNASVEMKKSQIAVAASLKDIVVYDPTVDAVYPKILSIDGEGVFTANVMVYNNATQGDNYSNMEAVDTSVSLSTGCMKVIFLNKFVNDLLRFLDQFQAAKDAMADASAAAAESAAAAAQNIQASASRLALDIHLKAPIIIVPRNSTSDNVLLLNFGDLTVKNSFHPGGGTNKEGQVAVVDQMKVKLTDLKVSRAILVGGSPKAEILLVEPVTISVDISRNLSASWYHDIPEVDIAGSLDAFKASLSQGDFTMMMGVVNENLTEGQAQPAKPVSSGNEEDITPVTAPTASAYQEEQIVAEASTTVAAAPGGESNTLMLAASTAVQVHSKLCLRFQMGSLSAALYTGDSNLKSGTSSRDSALMLAQFALQSLDVKLDMKTDTSMSASVILNSIVLDDARPGRDKGITKMIRQKGQDIVTETPKKMIDVKFTQNATQDKNAEVYVNGLYICVCVEYLMAVADFFVKGMPKPPEQLPPPATPEPAKGASQPAAQPAAASTSPAGEMNLVLVVDHPEVVMVEDAMNMNTNALILDTHVSFHMRMTPDTQTMHGSVSGLQIISCIYAPEKREASKVMILDPADITLVSSAPQGKDHHIDISVTDIIMNISPATIRTITATLSGMSPQQSDADQAVPVGSFPNLWGVQTLQEANFWFLKMDETTEGEAKDPAAVHDALLDEDLTPVVERGEQLMMSVNKIMVKLEGGVGKRTVPLLITEMTFRSEVKDWSSKLYVSADLSMEVAYYNERLAVWEPLIEPVEDEAKHRPWEIGVEVMQNELLPPLDEDEADGSNATPVLPPPKMTINVKSTDIMQVTVSKTCLEVLGNLGKAFNDAYNLVEVKDKGGELVAPYVIQNHAGINMTVKLDDSFKIPTEATNMHAPLGPGDRLALYNSEQQEKLIASKSIIKTTQEDLLKTLIFIMEDFGATRELKVVKAETRAFGINQRAYPGEMWHMITETEASYGSKTITVRSPLQVKNHLPFGLELFYLMGSEVTGKCGEILPESSLNVPLEAVYCVPNQLIFKPMDAKYKESSDPFCWRDLKAGSRSIVVCDPSDPSGQPFFFNVDVEIENVLYENTGEKTAEIYTLHLYPCAVFRNLLPVPVTYNLEGSDHSVNVEEGKRSALFNANIGKSTLELTIPDYLGKQWRSSRQLGEKSDEFSVVTFEASDGTNLDLGIHTVTTKGYRELELYAPYWMVNMTGKTLFYKGGDDYIVTHDAHQKGAVMFSFRSKAFFGKSKKDKDKDKDKDKEGSKEDGDAEIDKKGSLDRKGTLTRRGSKRDTQNPSPKKKSKSKMPKKKVTKAELKVDESEWSDKFSLDTVGSSGTVSCKYQSYQYEVGVKITLTSSGLTKIVMFTPYYMLINRAPFTISCQEKYEGGDLTEWHDVTSGQCLPFWPKQTGKKLQMIAKVTDYALETDPFYFNEAHSTLLKLNHEVGGVNVDVEVMEAAVEIILQQYQTGLAAALLVNHTSRSPVEYNQNNVEEKLRLSPGDSCLYTWQNALGKRELVWSCGQKQNQKNDLVKDDIGEFFFDDDTKVYWVSFLDGMQRVILFTEDLALATMAQQAGELERVDQEINLSLQGMGLSLVNNLAMKEIAYMAITSSGVIWEVKKRKRFKALKVKQCQVIEAAYQAYVGEIIAGNKPKSRVQLEHKIDVDLGTEPMMMYKPTKGVIQRSFENGIWVQYRTSPHQLQLHAKIHRLQLDNQLPEAIFPIVLAPVPPPKSVAADSVPKPFTEVSVMVRKREFTNVMQIKYCKVLVQEMSVKVDQGFLNNLIMLFAGEEASEEDQLARFKEDIKYVDTDLKQQAQLSSESEHKNYYDMLHFSPLKIHLSFSMYAGSGDSGQPTPIHSDVLNLFLQSVGVVLSDIQDVIFKLGYFERNYKFYNQSQLTGEIGRHYAQQAIKQMYVLVLGLDVLGNPFGLVRGLAEGIEDLFYEPYQGAIQGPEEFAEGLALGVRSLFGHAVGGAAGAVSRITGALGKGIATLTMDDDYQRKRREAMAKKPTDFKEGLARGGKGLVMGVVDGVTGIVRKPVEGAKQEGVEGFFKGMGKGLVGVFTRPASGVVDFASTSFEGIRRATDMSEEVRRLRPPRFLHKDGIVRPYIHREAEGNDIIKDMEKGKFAESDSYIAHTILTKDLKNVLLVTDKRVILASKGEIFGHWDCDWQYTWGELREAPSLTSKGIQILLKEKQKKSFFSHGTVGKLVPITDPKVAEWMLLKIKEAMAKVS